MKGNVYFIGCGSLIKIGFAQDVTQRLAQLQTGNPEPLCVTAVIVDAPASLERLLHFVFKAARARGEWFNKSPDLSRLISHVQAGAKPKTLPEIVYYASLEDNSRRNSNAYMDVRITYRELHKKGYAWSVIRSMLLQRGAEYETAVSSLEKRYGKALR